MLRLDAPRSVSFCDGFSRRDFLHAGALSAFGLTLPGFLAQKAAGAVKDDDVNAIMLFLVGGPSQLDTWDPKPNAPTEIRGPFTAIDTNVPGIRISEIFPKMARHADKYSLIRSCYHTATAVHDTGHQMMQTGRLFTGGVEHPHEGCVLGYLKGGRGEMPAHVLLPKPIGRTGGNLPHGQTAGYLGSSTTRSCLTPTPTTRISPCPTCCRRTTSRPSARAAVRRCATPWRASWPPSSSRPRPNRWTTISAWLIG